MVFASLIAVIFIAFVFGRKVFSVKYKTAIIVLIIFSILLGLLLSTFFLVFTIDSIFTSFVVTSLMFGIVSVFGYFTKKDLTSLRMLCFTGLIGIVLAGAINILIMNDKVSFISSLVGVIMFTLIVAADTQTIKERLSASKNMDEINKISLYSALML